MWCVRDKRTPFDLPVQVLVMAILVAEVLLILELTALVRLMTKLEQPPHPYELLAEIELRRL